MASRGKDDDIINLIVDDATLEILSWQPFFLMGVDFFLNESCSWQRRRIQWFFVFLNWIIFH